MRKQRWQTHLGLQVSRKSREGLTGLPASRDGTAKSGDVERGRHILEQPEARLMLSAWRSLSAPLTLTSAAVTGRHRSIGRQRGEGGLDVRDPAVGWRRD